MTRRFKVGDKVRAKYAGINGAVAVVREGIVRVVDTEATSAWPIRVEFTDGKPDKYATELYTPDELELIEEEEFSVTEQADMDKVLESEWWTTDLLLIGDDLSTFNALGLEYRVQVRRKQ